MPRKKVEVLTPQQKRYADNQAACLKYIAETRKDLYLMLDDLQDLHNQFEDVKDKKWFEVNSEEFRDKCGTINHQFYQLKDKSKALLDIVYTNKNRKEK